MPTNSAPVAVKLFSSAFVVSGCTVDASTMTFPFNSCSSMTSTAELTAASSPRHMKMMSALLTASLMVSTTLVLSAPRAAERSSERFLVRLKRINGLSRFPFSTKFLHIP
jgi:hypothetical protein